MLCMIQFQVSAPTRSFLAGSFRFGNTDDSTLVILKVTDVVGFRKTEHSESQNCHVRVSEQLGNDLGFVGLGVGRI